LLKGLKGTGSHHIALKDVRVPEFQVVDPFKGVSRPAGNPCSQLAPAICGDVPTPAFAVGLAEGAVQDLINLTARRSIVRRSVVLN